VLDTLILYFEQFVAAVGAAAHSAVLATAVRYGRRYDGR
jgi:hypothetical protein